MRLTWRDGLTAVLALLAAAIALAVTREWSWPLLGTPRAAVGVLGVVGYAMCMLGIRGSKMTTAGDLVRGPFMIAASALGAIALVLVVVGLIVSSETVVVAVAADLLLLWLVATARHGVEGPRVRTA